MNKVLHFFEEISKIPRGSYREQAISDYFMAFAKSRGLKAIQDKALNVVIYKPGSPGHENKAPLLLQSHMDMVWEKNANTVHNFETDPIKLRKEGDFIYATGTTLGADNGVGVALSLALLDSSDIAHPPLEVLFTSEEEVTMKGIGELDAGLLSARRMINFDSGDDSSFCVGCAGGGRLEFNVPVEREPLPAGSVCLILTVRGLQGGHSGLEIDCGRANSIRVLGRALNALKKEAKIVSVSGGLKANAIPREADAVVAIPAAEVGRAEQILSALQQTLRKEYRIPDPDITLALSPITESNKANKANKANQSNKANHANKVFTVDSARRVISALLLIPYGVLHMSADIPDLVETSNNMGVLETRENTIYMDCALRSSVPSRREFIKDQILALAVALDGTVDFAHGYPAWTYDPDSPLLAVATRLFKEMYNKDPGIEAVHAGLECGYMMEKIPDMDIISYCSNVYDYHTPNEHMSVSSLEKVWKYTLELLKRL